MVDNQVRTCDVTDHALISAMQEVPREAFVPADRAEFAYIDEDIALDPIGPADRYLMEPAQFARLVQLAEVDPDDIVLLVGAGTGYAAAVLSLLCGSVVAIEENQDLADFAEAALLKLEYNNVATLKGEHQLGYPKEGPYDVIFLNGAVDYVPETLKEQLQEGGRLVAVEGIGNSGVAKVYLKERGIVSSRETMNCAIRPLPGFQQDAGFVF